MRALIISPYESTQRALEYELSFYFDRELKKELAGMKVLFEKFGSFKQMEGKPFATQADILAVFDRRMCPPPRGVSERRKSQTSFLSELEIKPEFVRATFDGYVSLCTKNDVPTVLYQGELERNLRAELDRELIKVKDAIVYRIAQGNKFA